MVRTRKRIVCVHGERESLEKEQREYMMKTDHSYQTTDVMNRERGRERRMVRRDSHVK